MESLRQNQPYFPNYVRILLKNEKGSKDFYDMFIKNLYLRPKSEIKWEIELNFHKDKIWWEHVNYTVNSNDCTIKWLQYRIIHRILGTNYLLHKIGIKDTNQCTFCNAQPETISHLFYFCSYSLSLWNNIKDWLRNEFDLELNINEIDVIFGYSNNKKIQVLTSLLKKYIYMQRLKKCIPSLEGAKTYISLYLKAEKFTFQKNMKFQLFEKKWGSFERLTL